MDFGSEPHRRRQPQRGQDSANELWIAVAKFFWKALPSHFFDINRHKGVLAAVGRD
jgi:hypothetical protein